MQRSVPYFTSCYQSTFIQTLNAPGGRFAIINSASCQRWNLTSKIHQVPRGWRNITCSTCTWVKVEWLQVSVWKSIISQFISNFKRNFCGIRRFCKKLICLSRNYSEFNLAVMVSSSERKNGLSFILICMTSMEPLFSSYTQLKWSKTNQQRVFLWYKCSSAEKLKLLMFTQARINREDLNLASVTRNSIIRQWRE